MLQRAMVLRDVPAFIMGISESHRVEKLHMNQCRLHVRFITAFNPLDVLKPARLNACVGVSASVRVGEQERMCKSRYTFG